MSRFHPSDIRRRRRTAGRHRGFSLVELLVVIGIIAVLMGLIMPAFGKAREHARRTKCLANLRTIGQGLYLYANYNRDRLPNGNPPTVWNDPMAADWVMVSFAEQDLRGGAGAFHCPSDRDHQPMQITNAIHNEETSARVSYEFYSLFFAPEYGPKLAAMKGRAPLAWDQDGGPRAAGAPGAPEVSPVENHGPRGGNVLFADGHAEWKDLSEWEEESMPAPAAEFYPKP